jgi:hypothetical protein
MPQPQPDFATLCRRVQERHAAAGRERDRPEYPFCLDGGNGVRIDAMAQMRTTLIGLGAILLVITAAITAIFTFGLVLQILVVLAVLLGVVWLVRNAAAKQLGEVWQREAAAYPAAVVMAHGSLHEPGPSVAPGVMLVDFGMAPDAARMQRAAKAVHELAAADHVSVVQAPLRDWLQLGMQRARFDRLQVPREVAGNDTSWLISLRFDRKMMPSGHVDRSLWFVKARPGREESAEILPHSFWADAGG